MGPSPGVSATLTLSASLSPMRAKFSGNAARFAPCTRACSSKLRAEARFASTSGVEVIWRTAARVREKPRLFPDSSKGWQLLRALPPFPPSLAVRPWPLLTIELVTRYFRLGGGRVDALHHRIV